jgi:hypothetical protein
VIKDIAGERFGRLLNRSVEAAGAPVIRPEGAQNAVLRAGPPRGSSVDAGPSEGVSPRGPYREPVVSVWVSGVRLEMPEHALSEALSVLRLTTEGHVSLRHYAAAVGASMTALANNGLITVHPSQPVHKARHNGTND